MQLDRWGILAVLFTVRCGMGFQFQAVPALSPLFIRDFGVSVADLGLLIGLYHAPGIALAYPGGAIGGRLGDKVTVLAGLALMALGGLVMALSASWSLQIGGRLIAGVGSILLNVMMSKMVTDWFAGKEIATAMGIFVNSWPVGIALALLVLPGLTQSGSLTPALLVVVAALLAGMALLAAFYRPAEAAVTSSTAPVRMADAANPSGTMLAAILIAGGIWGTYNAALAMIFGFGPLMLVERGFAMASASSTTSVTLWLIGLSVPAGGLIADRSGRPVTVLLAGLCLFALALLAAPRSGSTYAAFIALGIVGGLSAGAIMSLPSRVLTAATRATGMGLFFTVFYACQLAAPWLAGHLAVRTGSVAVAFDFGAALLLVCGGLVGVFLAMARTVAASASAGAPR